MDSIYAGNDLDLRWGGKESQRVSGTGTGRGWKTGRNVTDPDHGLDLEGFPEPMYLVQDCGLLILHSGNDLRGRFP